jgi:hypothetical protein
MAHARARPCHAARRRRLLGRAGDRRARPPAGEPVARRAQRDRTSADAGRRRRLARDGARDRLDAVVVAPAGGPLDAQVRRRPAGWNGADDDRDRPARRARGGRDRRSAAAPRRRHRRRRDRPRDVRRAGRRGIAHAGAPRAVGHPRLHDVVGLAAGDVGVARGRVVRLAGRRPRGGRARRPHRATSARPALAAGGSDRLLGAGPRRARRGRRDRLRRRAARRARGALPAHRRHGRAPDEPVRRRRDRAPRRRARRLADADQARAALPAGPPRRARGEPGRLAAPRRLLRSRPPALRGDALRPRPPRPARAPHPARRPRALRRRLGPVDGLGLGGARPPRYDGRTAWRTNRTTSRFAFTPEGFWCGKGGVAPGQPWSVPSRRITWTLSPGAQRG